MISTFILKTALLSWGITIQDVKFDIDGECVIVNYSMKGAQQRKAVSFQEIEQLFKTDSEAPAASPGGDLAPGHTIPPD